MSITVALSKGRLADQTVELLEKIGINCDILKIPSRKLILSDPTGEFNFIFVKPTDVPIYVERGAADIGVCGKDTIMEEDKNVYELLDLHLANCRLCVAGYAGTDIDSFDTLRVSTKYVNISKKYFAKQQQNIEIIKLSGSIELGPVVGLSDVILDIVESGKTLKENDLVVLREVCPVSARLIVNKVSLKTKDDIIRPLVKNLKNILEEN